MLFAKLFSFYVFFMPALSKVKAQAGKHSCVEPVYVLHIETKDLETEEPLKGSKIVITGSNGQQAEFTTNDTGYVCIENFILPQTSYTIKVSSKGYLTDDQQSTITSQVNTYNFKKSAQFWKVFKFRKLLGCSRICNVVDFKENTDLVEEYYQETLNIYASIVSSEEVNVHIEAAYVNPRSKKLLISRLAATEKYLIEKGINPARIKKHLVQVKDGKDRVSLKLKKNE